MLWIKRCTPKHVRSLGRTEILMLTFSSDWGTFHAIESGILAEGSVSSVTEGKMYNRAVRIYKYIYEALLHLKRKQFIPWVVSANHANRVPEVREVEAKVSEIVEAFSQEQFDGTVNSQSMEELYKLWGPVLTISKC